MSKQFKNTAHVKKLSNAADINGIFSEIMGLKDAEPEIIIPKFVEIRNTAQHIYKILKQVATFKLLVATFPELKNTTGEISTFADLLEKNIVFGKVPDTAKMYVNMDIVKINQLYKKLKENIAIQHLIVLCSKLNRYQNCIGDMNNLKDNFIGQEPGLTFNIFNFANLDLKWIWAHEKTTAVIKNYILNILHILWVDTYNIYKIITSPDIEIKKFACVLTASICDIERIPELHRCKNAFNRIKNSVNLLEDKFNDYYRESIECQNANLIIESFIIDVSNQKNIDARLTREFRQIIQFLHKISQQTGGVKDPTVKKMFSVLNKNFALMEGKQTVEPIVDTSTEDIEDLDISVKTTKSPTNE